MPQTNPGLFAPVLVAAALGAVVTPAAAQNLTFPPGTNCSSLLYTERDACINQARRMMRQQGQTTIPGTGNPGPGNATDVVIPNATAASPNGTGPGRVLEPNSTAPGRVTEPNSTSPNGMTPSPTGNTSNPPVIVPNGTPGTNGAVNGSGGSAGAGGGAGGGASGN